MTQKRSVVTRMVVGLWNGLNFTRRLVLNLIVLFLLVVFAVGVFAPKPHLQKRTTLVLAPSGALVEQFSADPVERAFARASGDPVQEVQLRDLLRAIDQAAKDDRIERLVIRPDRLTGGGLAALREVRDALQRFRASGKQVVAYADGMDQKQYLLASAADTIWLHPEGAVLLEGFSRYRLYYREALQDKLKVDVHLFRVGEYKSAAEPFILDGPSPEAQEADLHWMGDLWQRYVAEVAEARKLDPQALEAAIDDPAAQIAAADGQPAQMALDIGLVDALKTEDEVRDELIARGVEDADNHTFRQVDLDQYLGFLGPAESPLSTRPKVAVVVAQGEISGGEQPPGTVGGDSTSALLRDAREDDQVEAVVLRVDSPGGEGFASEQIRREVELLKAAGKPVVVSMSNLAASGGYWISMNADRIFASPSTITGSIGIFGLIPTVQRTLASIGARVGGVGTTPLAGAFDVRRELNPQLAAMVQRIIDRGYQEFVGKVAAARGREPAEIDRIARGRVWSGAQALELGLVDELGGLQAAIADAGQRAGLDAGHFDVHYVEKDVTPFARFVADLSEQGRVQALLGSTGLTARLLPPRVLGQLEQDLDFLTRPVAGPMPARVVAHCFCGL